MHALTLNRSQLSFRTLLIHVALAFSIAIPSVLPTQRPPALEFAKDFLTGLVFAVTHPTGVRNILSDTVVDLLDAGAGAGDFQLQTAATAEVATMVCSDPAFGNSVAGVATANAITDDPSAAGGTTDRFIGRDSDANTVFLGSVTGTGGGGDIELTSLIIAATDIVGLSNVTYAAAA